MSQGIKERFSCLGGVCIHQGVKNGNSVYQLLNSRNKGEECVCVCVNALLFLLGKGDGDPPS